LRGQGPVRQKQASGVTVMLCIPSGTTEPIVGRTRRAVVMAIVRPGRGDGVNDNRMDVIAS
jgi:hypothetical protein